MSKVTYSEFFNNDYVNQASYDNLRKISSVIDGLKNSSRKVIYTALNKLNEKPMKLNQLAAEVAQYTNYLHGSLDGVLVSLGRNYTGTNNLPLLVKKGNFGTRVIDTPAASRYISASKPKYISQLFDEDNIDILPKQEFEGKQIECRYLCPIIPTLLVNGNNGVSSGFAQNILPRNLNEVIDLLKKTIKSKNKNFSLFNKLLPYFGENYKGKISKEDNKILLSGVYKVSELRNDVIISIIDYPINLSHSSFIKALEKICEGFKKASVDDLSYDDNIEIKINCQKQDKDSILTKICKKLESSETENYVCIDENNKIIIFNNVGELVEHYYNVRIDYLNKKKRKNLLDLKEKLEFLVKKYKFIKYVIENGVEIINTMKEEDIVDCNIKEFKDSNLEKLKNNIKEVKENFEKLKATTVEDIWLDELKNFKVG